MARLKASLAPGATAAPTTPEDDDGQVRVTTDAIERVASSVVGLPYDQLPLFEGHRFPAATITFGGGLDFAIKDDDPRELIHALNLGRRVVVRLSIGEELDSPTEPRVIALDAEVVGRSFAFKGADAIPTTTAKVQINGRRHEPEED